MYQFEESGARFQLYFWLPSHSNLWIVLRHYLKTNIYINSYYGQCTNSFKNVKEALTLSLLVIYFLNILYNLNVIFITILFFVIFIHVQLFSFMLNIVGARHKLKKRTGWINIINNDVSRRSHIGRDIIDHAETSSRRHN